MQSLTQRFADLGRGPAILGIAAFVMGVISIGMNLDPALGGDGVALSRVVLGLLGVGGGVLLWLGRNFGMDGRRLILIWSILQVPSFAERPDGNVTEQVIDFFLGATNENRVNGDLTSYSAIGINLIGVILVIWAQKSAGRLDLWRRRAAPANQPAH